MTDRERAMAEAQRLAACYVCGPGQDDITDALLEAGACELDAMILRYCRMCANATPFAPPPNELHWHAVGFEIHACGAVLLRQRAAELRAQKGGGA